MDKTCGLITMERMDNRIFDSIGSSRIRMRWMLPYWDEAEEYIIGKKYEVMVYQKVYWGPMMDKFEGVQILDLCDPDWLENKPVFEYIDKVDAVVTSTEELAKYIRKLRPNALIKYIPDRINLSEVGTIKTEHRDTIKTVVWFGYLNNTRYLTSTFDELIKRGIELVVIADASLEPTLIYKNKIKIYNTTYNASTVNREIIKYDAVLMPDPTGDERARFKSPNKTVQSWALGMPVIRVPEDFDRLASKEVREKEGRENRQRVEKEFDVKLSAQEYKELIKEINGKKSV